MAGESNLVVHARRELRSLLENPDPMEREVAESILAAVKAFAGYEGHSGSSHFYAVSILERLLGFGALGPLTDDPAEWQEIDEDIAGKPNLWQNRRQSDAFSEDGGRTYYVLSEDRWRGWGRRGPWRRRLVRDVHAHESASAGARA